MGKISQAKRYIVCGQVTKRPVFEFISSAIHPNATLIVFPLEDDYSFGVLQSWIHWDWFLGRCSTIKGDPRYPSTTIFNSFPFHQQASEQDILRIAEISRELREIRAKLMIDNNLSFRELYKTLELPGKNLLKEVHDRLDTAVRAAYGMSKTDSSNEFIFELNRQLGKYESRGIQVQGPGVPSSFNRNKDLVVSDDCVQ